MPRHDHDAGGDPEVLDAKARLREEVWDRLEEEGAAGFPGAQGRIPNFAGAGEAAEALRTLEFWSEARTLKVNPDYPQLPVRKRALEDGKVVYMAVPRLADPDPFFLLDPDSLDEPSHRAASIRGASRNATRVAVEDLEPVDLVIVGCVAVDRSGARLGKGGGFSDLEYAVALEAGLIEPTTPVVTTVHPLQVLEEGRIPVTEHDVRLDWIVTPEEVIRVRYGGPSGSGGADHAADAEHPGDAEDAEQSGKGLNVTGGKPASREVRRPTGIRWDELTEEKIESIPLLQRLREASDRDG